jgi:hypothetical protein
VEITALAAKLNKLVSYLAKKSLHLVLAYVPAPSVLAEIGLEREVLIENNVLSMYYAASGGVSPMIEHGDHLKSKIVSDGYYRTDLLL